MEIIKVDKELSPEQRDRVTKTLRSGGLVIYPTETAYGLGAMAISLAGVEKLMEYKTKREGKAISVAVGTRKMAEEYVELNVLAQELYKNYLPGPVTIISRLKKERVEEESFKLLAPNGTLGIRIPDHIIVRQITEALGVGITATSANESGGMTPYSVEDVLESISDEQKELIDIIIDYGELPVRAASTIVDTMSDPAWILRGEGKGVKLVPKYSKEYLISKEGELQNVLADIWRNLDSADSEKKNLVFLLNGELGTGKTSFVKTLGRALLVKGQISSPSFVLEKQYKVGEKNFSKLYHYDFWRLEQKDLQSKEKGQILEKLGVKEALKSETENVIIAIEWSDRVGDLSAFFKLIGCNVVRVNLEYGKIGQERKLSVGLI